MIISVGKSWLLTGPFLVGTLTLLLGACGDGAGRVPGGTTSSTTSSSTGTAVPSVPVRPTTASAKTDAGAEAFVGYWWELYGYSFASMESGLLRHVSAPDCGFCTSTAGVVEEHASESARFTGVRATTRDMFGVVYADRDVASVTGYVDLTDATVVGRSGNLETSYPARPDVGFVAALRWVDGEWSMAAMALGDDDD